MKCIINAAFVRKNTNVGWRGVHRRHRQVNYLDTLYRLAEARAKLLKRLGSSMLQDVQALSVTEEELVRSQPSGAERYQYVVDAVTHGLGEVIEDFTRSLTDRQPSADEPSAT